MAGDDVQKIKLLDVERRLERVERLLRAAADEARNARTDLGRDGGPGERWARMMFGVLQDLDGLGGEVSRRQFLQIGERHGYNHRGWPASISNSWSRGPDTRRASPLRDESA